MVANRDKVRQSNGSNLTYPAWLKQRLKATNEPITSQELAKEYEIETGIKITKQSATEALKRVGFGSLIRRERLQWYPIEKKSGSSQWLGSKSGSQPIHSSHNYRFSIEYQGIQPKDGVIRAWGRNKQQIQVEYRLTGEDKLQVFKNRIVIMLHSSKGITTEEQLNNARKVAYMSILGFVKEHNLTIDKGYLEKKLLSHHVLEPKELNYPIQQSLGEFEKQIEARTGSLILGDGSHDGVEHQGGGLSNLKGEEAAKNFEWLLWKFRYEWNYTHKYMGEYDKNLKLHVEVMQEIKGYIKELRKVNKKVNR